MLLTIYQIMKGYARNYLMNFMTNQMYLEELKEPSLACHQWRLGKSEGEPGTPLPATNSDRQSQKVGLGNLTLNSPNEIVSDIFHDIYCCSKCVSMDETGIWSILTDTLHFVKTEIDSSVIFSYDQKRHQNSKSKYFDAAFLIYQMKMITIQ